MMSRMNKLSAKEIEVAVKNAGDQTMKIRKLADGGGLYLWVRQDGTACWRYRFYVNGVEKLMSLGVYPGITLAKARGKRDGATVGEGADKMHVEGVREQLKDGRDPAAIRKADKLASRIAKENSFKAVADAWYGKQVHAWTPRYADTVRYRIDTDSKAILKRPISELEPPELLAALEGIEKESTVIARKVRGMWSQIFLYAVASGKCTRNPVADLGAALKAHVAKNRPHVTQDELPALLRTIDAYAGDRKTVIALKLLAMTFVRAGELAGATWNEFDLNTATWIIPAERMKMQREHVVPLSTQAVALLTELKALSNAKNPWVFPGRTREPPMAVTSLVAALYRMGLKGVMSAHGFRHIASTILNESGWNPDWIEAQLAHVSGGVRAIYNKARYLDDRRRMMAWYSDYLDGLQSGAVVTPIARKSA